MPLKLHLNGSTFVGSFLFWSCHDHPRCFPAHHEHLRTSARGLVTWQRFARVGYQWQVLPRRLSWHSSQHLGPRPPEAHTRLARPNRQDDPQLQLLPHTQPGSLGGQVGGVVWIDQCVLLLNWPRSQRSSLETGT